MDFIVKLPLSKNTITDVKYDSILVIVNRLTKYAHFIPCVVPPPQENMDNGPSLFNCGQDNPINDLINDFDPYLEYDKGYQNRTAFEDAFYE